MPPKKRASKASPPAQNLTDSEGDTPAPAKKKAKAAPKPKGPVTPLDPSVPHNTAFPDTLEFSRPGEGEVRVAMWNVCGLKACEKKVSATGGG